MIQVIFIYQKNYNAIPNRSNNTIFENDGANIKKN